MSSVVNLVGIGSIEEEKKFGITGNKAILIMVRVTKQKVDTIKKRLKENFQKANEFMESLKDEKMMIDAEDKAAAIKLKLERNLEN